MVISDEEELRERTRAFNVSRNKACGRSQVKREKLSSQVVPIVSPVATPDLFPGLLPLLELDT